MTTTSRCCSIFIYDDDSHFLGAYQLYSSRIRLSHANSKLIKNILQDIFYIKFSFMLRVVDCIIIFRVYCVGIKGVKMFRFV